MVKGKIKIEMEIRRRGRDSNSRSLTTQAFQACAFDHSATSALQKNKKFKKILKRKVNEQETHS